MMHPDWLGKPVRTVHILAVGLNHRTAPVEIREKFAVGTDQLPAALQQLKQTTSILECVIVSTCNRTEIYAVVDRLHVCGHILRAYMSEWFGVPSRDFAPYLYIYEDDQAVRHLFRVACGLDSMVIGETQILGQVRDAFLRAQQEKTTGILFNTLFRQAVTLAKRAHSETAVGESAVSVSYAAVELVRRAFGQFADKRVVIVGAGKMGELTAKHLHAGGVSRMMVVNRTPEKAKELADLFRGTAHGFDELPELLREADIVISSTGSRAFVLTLEQVEQAMGGRRSRPLFLIDIAVPRDIDPDAANVPGVCLYDIDDLEHVVENNMAQRQREALKIERMIREELREFERWYKTLSVRPVIRALQEKAARIHEETMESLFHKLPNLEERERKIIRKLTKSIVHQLLHDPILRIKEMAAEENGDEVLDTAVALFALEDLVSGREPEEDRREAGAEWPASALRASRAEPERLLARL
jgi:glutamyl-tRNA reductase